MKQVTGPSYNIFQQGFSMVELMVAMVLTLVLITGIIQVFNSSKQTYRTQDDVIQIQENGRFALDILERHIRMADFPNTNITFTGSTPYINGKQLTSMYPALQKTPTTKDDAIVGTDGKTDSISLRYYTATSACGNSPFTASISTFKFRIVANQLVCSLEKINNTPVLTPTDIPLLNNVVNMQIQYGIDGNSDPSAAIPVPPKEVTRYETNPNAVTREKIVSIRLALLIKGNTPTTGNCNGSYTLLDKSIATTDCYLYKVVQTTVRLRNRLNGKV